MVMKWSLVVGSFGKAVGHLYGHQGSILGVCSQEEVPCHLSLLFKKKRKNSNDKMYNYCNKNIFLERRYDHVKVDLQCLHGLQIFFLMFRHHINLETEHELHIATSLDWSFFKHIRKKSTELDCHQIVDLKERFIICLNAKLFCFVVLFTQIVYSCELIM